MSQQSTKKEHRARPSLSRDAVREIDRRAIEELGLPGIVLMENAGRGATELLISVGVQGKVIVVAGKGNNGGDGFVIARHLSIYGFDVGVLLVGSPNDLKGDALTNFAVLQRARAEIRVLQNEEVTPEAIRRELKGHEWIVDALLGTGVQGEIRDPYRTVIEAINASDCRVFAVDLPSGMDCDTGEPLGVCVRAEKTATFVACKQGFDCAGSSSYTGEVHMIGIGVPKMLIPE